MQSTDAKKIEKLLESNKKTERQIKDFEKQIAEMKDDDSPHARLWIEIYNNAVSDRTCASALFTQAFSLLGASAADHVSLGTTLVKYLERMSKSNEQLLSLSQLIEKDRSEEKTLSTKDIFSQIEE